MRWLVAILLCCALWAPGQVRADNGNGVVAVLPLAATNHNMALYGKPVADAVAKRLRKAVAMKIEALSLSGAVPSRVSLVVDGRIVTPKKRQVLLEARIRDPERGTVVTSLATKPRRRLNIDVLARELADKLAPRLKTAYAQQLRRRARAAAARRRAAAAAARRKRETQQPKPKHTTRPSTPSTPVDNRPVMLVMEVTGKQIANDDVVPRVVTPKIYKMVERLGFRPLPGGHRGIVDPLVVRNALRAHGGRYALMVDVPEVKLDWHRVLLSARAKVRVVLVSAAGKPVFARTLRTGTLVGSRGDGYAAMVNFVATQAVDMFAPKLRRALGKGPS